MKLSKQQMMIIAGGLILLVLVGFLVFRGKGNTKQNITSTEPTEAVIPTVDSSVLVELTPQNGLKQITLSVKDMPNGTVSMEYEISYMASNRESPGIYSTLTLESGQRSWQKTFDVGTCSSGKCIFDNVTSPMKVSLKFSGNFGDKIFEKDFNVL